MKKRQGGGPGEFPTPPLWALGDSSLLFEPELDNLSWSSLCLCRCPHSGFVLLPVEPGIWKEKDHKCTISLMVLQILVLSPNRQLLFNFQSPWKAAICLLSRFLLTSSVEYVYYHCTQNVKILSCLNHWIIVGFLITALKYTLTYQIISAIPLFCTYTYSGIFQSWINLKTHLSNPSSQNDELRWRNSFNCVGWWSFTCQISLYCSLLFFTEFTIKIFLVLKTFTLTFSADVFTCYFSEKM